MCPKAPSDPPTAQRPPPDDKTPGSAEPLFSRPVLRFSFLRLMLAVAAVGIVFSVTRPLGGVGIMLGIPVAISSSLLVLLTRPNQLPDVIRSALASLAGAALAFGLLTPGVRRPWNDDGGFGVAMLGATVGWLLGIAYNENRRKKRQAVNPPPTDTPAD